MKKGFTLAEILIVLTIIGVLAVMTIPSLLQNANSQHKIAMFKKGFNAVSNAYATEFALKSPPKTSDDTTGINLMFNALANQLNVKYFYNYQNGEKLYTKPTVYYWKYRIITEDGIMYYVYRGEGENCNTRLNVNSKKSYLEAKKSTCIGLWIGVDNVDKESVKRCEDNANLSALNCDVIDLFVTKDGVTAGNPDCTIAGRIMSDNFTYDEAKCAD